MAKKKPIEGQRPLLFDNTESPISSMPSVAVLRDGTTISQGEEVNMNRGLRGPHQGHEDKAWVVEKITPYEFCESKSNVIAHLKENPEIKTTGTDLRGIDTNWFKKITV